MNWKLLISPSWWNKNASDGNFSNVKVSRKHRPDYMIVLVMGLLMLLGLVIIYAIGPQRAIVLNNAYGANYGDSYFFIKQLQSLVIAVIAFVVAFKFPINQLGKLSKIILIIAVLASVVLAVSGLLGLPFAKSALGATRWFNIFGISIQPSELLKIAILLFGAGFLGNRVKEGKINDFKTTIVPFLAILAVALLLVVVIQKDLGTGIAIMAIASAALFASGMDSKILIRLAIVFVLLGSVMIFSSPHRVARISTFFKGDSTSVEDAGSYHIEHAKIAIGSGGMFGVGIGNSVQATGYLPEAINDSVFAIMGEMFGFVGLVVIMLLFGALLMRILNVAERLVDPRLKLIAIGVFGWIAAHVVLNIGAMIGLIPLTGITLPLLSFGGTSMLFIAAALGLIFQLSGYTEHPNSSKLKETQNENSYSRRGVGRSRHTRRSSY